MNWQSPETAPRDGSVILADVGFSRAVVASWNAVDNQWVYANLACSMSPDGTPDTYFEYEYEDDIQGWMLLPEAITP